MEDKLRTCKECGIEIPYIKYRVRCFACHCIFLKSKPPRRLLYPDDD